jgi:Calcineurin-like phosphoesterase
MDGNSGFDVIGDVHGCFDALAALLTTMEYRVDDGVWRHPAGRRAVFVGDLIDRGSQQVQVVDAVRAMVEGNSALICMGNHEWNALGWATENPNRPGEFLRPHTDKHRHQHKAFLFQVGEGSRKHEEMIGWFRTIPLW